MLKNEFQRLTEEVCRGIVDNTAYSLFERRIVKCVKTGINFSCHQKKWGYLGYDHKPCLSCLCALDEVYESNGMICVVPFSNARYLNG